MWHRPPLIAAANHVQDRIDNFSPTMARWASTALDRWNNGFQ
jgi:hypothetical protein